MHAKKPCSSLAELATWSIADLQEAHMMLDAFDYAEYLATERARLARGLR